jgi:hypothetical protein
MGLCGDWDMGMGMWCMGLGGELSFMFERREVCG